MKTRKLIASAVAAATLGAGGLAVAAVNPLATAGAETAAPAADESRPQRGHVLTEALAGLVAKGTITQAQADAVTDAVKAEVKDNGGRGHGQRRRAVRKATVATAAEVIGVSTDDLVAALEDGKSIADVAASKGVETQKVVDALVAAGTERIDKAVADGKLPTERAAALKERLPAAAERAVNATRKG